MKQKLISIAAICLVITLVVTYWPKPKQTAEAIIRVTSPTPAGQRATTAPEQRQWALLQDRERIAASFHPDQPLLLEVVNSQASITQGLSGRKEIGSDGMLFLFQTAQIPSFWMKEMQFPLDLIWLADGKIVEITENVPAPSPQQPLNTLPTYRPAQPVTAVLEVVAGTAKKWQLQVGETLTYSP